MQRYTLTLNGVEPWAAPDEAGEWVYVESAEAHADKMVADERGQWEYAVRALFAADPGSYELVAAYQGLRELLGRVEGA